MKTVFEKSLLVLSYFLMVEKVNGGIFLQDGTTILSQGLQFLDTMMVNMAWAKYEATWNSPLPGHIKSAANCNASLIGDTQQIALSDFGSANFSIASLCPGSSSFQYFLYETIKGSGSRLETLAACLLNQSFTAEFCNAQQSRQADNEENERIYDTLLFLIPGLICGSLILGLLIYFCRNKYRTGHDQNTSNISSTSSATIRGEERPLLEERTALTERSSIFSKILGNANTSYQTARREDLPSPNDGAELKVRSGSSPAV